MVRAKQMRRRTRRMRRQGLQPIVLIEGGEALPAATAAVLARWLWRYRSELAPVVLAALLAALAGYLHAAHPHSWTWQLPIACILTAMTLGFGDKAGLSVRLERVYAAFVLFTSGLWLAAATTFGITHSPLPQLLLAGGPLLSIPWWTHRRLRAKVRVDRKLAAWPEVAPTVGLSGSRVMSAIVDHWGWRARFALARGQTIQDVTAKIPALESALGTHRGAVRIYPTRDDRANRFELRVLDRDPHADAIPWPGPSTSTITDPIDLGPFEDATTTSVLFLRRHALLGGIAGSGKSGALNVIMGNLTACHDVVIWAIDLKRGMELQPWSSCIARLATTPDQAKSLLKDAVAVLEARATHLAATGLRVWHPTPTKPALVIVIDEYAELAEDAPESIPNADSIARRGRAVAVTLIAATQRPTQKAMGKGAVRSQMDIRLSFRVRERRDTDLILGQGMLAAGWHPHTLNAPGKFLISAPDHTTPRPSRAYLLTDQTVTQTAHHHTPLPPPPRRHLPPSHRSLPSRPPPNSTSSPQRAGSRGPRSHRRSNPLDPPHNSPRRGNPHHPPDHRHRQKPPLGLLPPQRPRPSWPSHSSNPRPLARAPSPQVIVHPLVHAQPQRAPARKAPSPAACTSVRHPLQPRKVTRR
ncbi:S-DNA-T family DNA segregation ATPase FtsK/SpoIIIE [Actinocorallia herbida]|uniref:S-DNA-T family DNA segregation ATPase FtsK/SpoIIIE n=1 Tax=Actinocorallia herbida TaxID=58109 RepID=A0A3N1D7S3_9ACTN|nr:FtsK/SpoIIIE domain-containing protein [Actinocorallia herbida]ROO89572.1 S-DNA-T family DNA segregation ATPase FtsK/SpoIIIE [Actinocorallia herbida]